ncbi:hypothetical protein [Algoriphagus sp. A40]|uniref:alpha/beta hydrolase family protein n=1 Tax=Algoriphagus sp. A40 TaxID=1945863 RepID=UPI0009CE6F62|nr:hypothetical protein [Algoriphagus sp. A40]OOG77116.1 hypothetical protein B0E43_05825 [Algoriphagus sp. A40]
MIENIFRPLLGLVLLLSIGQILLSGLYWQFLPAYLLLLLFLGKAFSFKHSTWINSGMVFKISLQFLSVALLLSWSVFLPVPKLTEPTGNFQVGTKIFRWFDPSRDEPLTADPLDRRNVVVQAWYPADPDHQGNPSVYLDGLDHLPPMVSGLPSFLLNHFDQINTYAILDSPVSKAKKKWPVILFLTGNGASRAFYTSLAIGLSSKGFVVLCLDHPYEAALTQLAGGKLATPIEVYHKDDPDLLQFMEVRLQTRLADVRFVLDQIGSEEEASNGFFSSLDQDLIGITGHSLGGTTAAVAMAHDSRIKAAANIDGTLYGELPKPDGPRPFLLLESNKDDPDRYKRYEAGNRFFFRQFGGGYRFEIAEADHYSFTDAPLFLAFPSRILAGRIFGIGDIPRRTHLATVDFLQTFFEGALNRKVPDLDLIASRRQGIIRKMID